MEAEPERPARRHPASAKPVSNARSESSSSSSVVLKEYIPEGSDTKRSEISSDDFDGIEIVEEELNEVTDDRSDRHPSPASHGSAFSHKSLSETLRSVPHNNHLDGTQHGPMRIQSPDWPPRDPETYDSSQTPSLEPRTQPTGDAPPSGNVTHVDVFNDDFDNWIEYQEPSEEESEHVAHGHVTLGNGDGTRVANRRIELDGESSLFLSTFLLFLLKGLVDHSMRSETASSPPVQDDHDATFPVKGYESDNDNDTPQQRDVPIHNNHLTVPPDQGDEYEYYDDNESSSDRDEYSGNEVHRNDKFDARRSNRMEQASRHQDHDQSIYEDFWQQGEHFGLIRYPDPH